MRGQLKREKYAAMWRKRGFGSLMESLESRMLLSTTAFIPGSLASFQSGVGGTGGTPVALIQDSSGNLFGVTTTGGSAGKGTVFEIAAGSSTIQTLASFTTTTGFNPTNLLTIDSSGNLFGITSGGGAFNKGTIFEVASGSSNVTPLAFLTPTDGTPTGSIVVDSNDNLFGETSGSGGASIFKVHIGGNVGTLSTVATFPANTTLGGTLVINPATGALFGTTIGVNGGAGTIFTVPANASAITTFGTFPTSAGTVTGGIVLNPTSGHFLVTTSGSGNVSGAVFDVDASGNFSALAPFATGQTPGTSLGLDNAGDLFGVTAGSNPTTFELAAGGATITTGSSISTLIGATPAQIVMGTSGNVFAITQTGGAGGVGSVFQITPKTVATVASFDGAAEGKTPLAVVEDAGGDIFGVTSTGGANGMGTLFEIVAGGSAITTLASFDSTSGAPTNLLTVDAAGDVFGVSGTGIVYEFVHGTLTGTVTPLTLTGSGSIGTPIGSLAFNNTTNSVIGMTSDGASGTTLFQIHVTDGNVTNPATFANTTLGSTLVVDSFGDLFGTTINGGANSVGSIFELTIGGSFDPNFFSFISSQGTPSGALAINPVSHDLVGTTLANGNATTAGIFDVDLTGTPVSIVHFAVGQTPAKTIAVDAAGDIFGLTTASSPVLFELAAGTTTIKTGPTIGGGFGTVAGGIVVSSAGNVFGVTQNGGASHSGSVFEIGGNNLTTQSAFSTATQKTNGANPIGLVSDSAGNFFGVTSGGGTSGKGTLFEIVAGSSTVTTLASFTSDSGTNPFGDLVIDAQGNIFGTTKSGGAFGHGGIYELQAGSGVIVNLSSFNSKTTGAPTGALAIDSSNTIFGTTTGGTTGGGEIFKLNLQLGSASIDAVGSAGVKGTIFGNTLVVKGTDVYGTTLNGTGTVFVIHTASSTARVTLATLDKSLGKPTGAIDVDNSGDVFGTTNGTVFEVVANSGIATKRAALTGVGHATGNIVLDQTSGKLFLTSDAGNGLLLELPAGGSALWTLATLTQSTGVKASGGLVVRNGVVYGTALRGGAGGVGAVYSVQLAATEQRLKFVQQPTSVNADAGFDTIIVDVVDPLGHTIATDNSTVALTLVGGDGTPIATAQAVNGVATFNGASVGTVGKFQLEASDGVMVPVDSNTFTITHGVATQLAVVSPPTSEVIGQKFSLIVQVQDAEGNVVTNDHSLVSLTVTGGPNGGALAGKTMVKASNGVATFNNLSLPLTGDYTIDAADGGLTPPPSVAIHVTGAPAQIVFNTLPATTTAGVNFSVVITLKDALGNVVLGDKAPVTLSLANAHGVKLLGTTTVNAFNGVATFSSVALTKAGTFTLVATQGQTTGNATFTNAAAAATKLKITSTLVTTTSNSFLVGTNLGPVAVAVEDQFGNVVTTDTSNVTLTVTGTQLVVINHILQLPAAASVVTVAAVAGVATFPSISIPRGFYSLIATDGTFTSDSLITFVGFPRVA